MKVAVLVCTRARRKMLEDCVKSLFNLTVPPGVEPSLIVVENDTKPECQQYIQSLALDGANPWRIVYGHEPNLGIPQARNRALKLALDHQPNWIAFIDDDEVVDAKWLERMLAAADEFGCDVIQGPVEYVYPEVVPDWLDEADTKQKQRAQQLRTAFTNNVFISSRILREDGWAMRFDETMRFSGGSDTEFFFRAADQGATIRWVDDAVVREIVVPSRMTMEWQWNRALRVAANAAKIDIKRKGCLGACARRLPKSITRLFRGVIVFVFGVAAFSISGRSGRKWVAKGGKDFSSGIGGAIGLLGFMPKPYKTVD